MRLVWTSHAWADYIGWQTDDPGVVRRINDLVKDACRNPFTGLGKPEPLRGELSGFWSRRITGEHRLVYRVSGKAETQALEIVQCRYHY
ncbi:MAG: Txe/YoeB family addiction module toxin [Hyphomicrobiaceae bacterium]|nr:Txe/YoeB family addiction module toxin [Hyphomicrobiaceae bacterium]